MWPFKKKKKAKILEFPKADVVSIGGFVLIEGQTFLLLEEPDSELYLLPVYEFQADEVMYQVKDITKERPARPALRRLGLPVVCPSLSLVPSSDELN